MKVRELFEAKLPDFILSNLDLTADHKLTMQYPDCYDFYVGHTELNSLKGSPEKVHNDFSCFDTDVTSLEFAPKYVGRDAFFGFSKITSLKGIGTEWLLEIKGNLFCNDCRNLKSSVLGIFKIKGLKRFYCDANDEQRAVRDIINKHLNGNRDIFECKEELVNAGLKEYAKF